MHVHVQTCVPLSQTIYSFFVSRVFFLAVHFDN